MPASGRDLGVECLNRFECYFLNTHADSARFVKDVESARIAASCTTRSTPTSRRRTRPKRFAACADVLTHVHISENDRSTPGSGNVRWEETFDTLKEVGYDGWMMIEAFRLGVARTGRRHEDLAPHVRE